MKLTGYLLVLALLSGLNSCMWGVPDKQTSGITKDTLAYTYQTIKDRAPHCVDKPDSACSLFTIRYPIFKSAKPLNDLLLKKLIRVSTKDTLINNINSLIGDFFKPYNDFNKHHSNKDITYVLNDSIRVLRQDSSLTTLEIKSYEFRGGAHGMNATSFVNWDSKPNKALKLSDIFKPGYEQQLTKIGETIFRKDEKLSETASLADDYFFKDAKFSLNENFLITPLGIKFLYNDYEIKPGAAGQTELLIPYAQIKSLLKPNTVITQYIK